MILHPIPTPRSIPAILLLATIGLAAGAPAQTAPPPGLDAYVHEVMETFEVPGLALAIVKDGEVVLAEGYGVRHLGEPAPVDPHTLFGIASKGRIAAGYDADLTIVDLKRRETITDKWMASRAGWTPYDGVTVTGWPVGTFVRGRKVMWQGALATPAQGERVRFLETLAS